MINSLKELLHNETFINLAIIQSLCDEVDPAMSEHNFTRSPYHVVAFLVAYAAANDIQRGQIIANLNNLVLEINFTQSALDALIDDISWSALLKREKMSNLPTYIDITFSIITPDKEAFIDAVSINCPHLSEALKTVINRIEIIESCEKDEIKFITKIQEKKIWLKKFHNQKKGDNYFLVPCFKLSESLKSIIKDIKEDDELILDNFKIKKGIGEDKELVQLIVKVPHECAHDNDFSVKLKQTVETSRGIYTAFLGLTSYCSLTLIRYVKVDLQSALEFTNIGTSVSQAQSYRALAYGFHKIPNLVRPTTITIESLDGILFLETAIAATITSKSTIRAASTQYYVDLEVHEGQPVRIYSAPLSALQTLHTAILFSDSCHPMLNEIDRLMPLKSFSEASQCSFRSEKIEPHSDCNKTIETISAPIGSFNATLFSMIETSKSAAKLSMLKADYPSAKRVRLDKEDSDYEAHAGAGLEPG